MLSDTENDNVSMSVVQTDTFRGHTLTGGVAQSNYIAAITAQLLAEGIQWTHTNTFFFLPISNLYNKPKDAGPRSKT